MAGLIREAVETRSCPNEDAEFVAVRNVEYEISVTRQAARQTPGLGADYLLNLLAERLARHTPVREPCGWEGEVDVKYRGTVATWWCPQCGAENERDTGDDADDDD